MKHRIIYLAISLVSFFCLGLGLLQPLVVEASRTTSGSQQPNTSSASTFCASWSGADKNTCIKDFNAGKSGQSVVDTCPSKLSGFPAPGVNNTGGGTDFYKCEGPWAAGAGNPPLGSGPATFCNNNFTGSYHSDCVNGTKNAKQDLSKACDKSDPAYAACVVGFANAGGDVNGNGGNGGNGPSHEATDACNTQTGNLYFACTSGYDGQTNGQSRGDACKAFNGEALTVCQGAWDESKTDNAPSSPTTPCNLKAGCDLINTYVNPIINFLSVAFGLIAVISIILGGIQYSASQGDPQKTSQAKSRISNTMIAIVAYLFLYAFLQFLIPGGLFH